MSTTKATDERVYYSPFSWDGLTKEEVIERLDRIDEDAFSRNDWLTLAEFKHQLFSG